MHVGKAETLEMGRGAVMEGGGVCVKWRRLMKYIDFDWREEFEKGNMAMRRRGR